MITKRIKMEIKIRHINRISFLHKNKPKPNKNKLKKRQIDNRNHNK